MEDMKFKIQHELSIGRSQSQKHWNTLWEFNMELDVGSEIEIEHCNGSLKVYMKGSGGMQEKVEVRKIKKWGGR